MSKTTWSEIPVAARFALVEKYKRKADLAADADQLGMKIQTLRRNIQNFIEYEHLFQVDAYNRLEVPDSPTHPYIDYHQIEEDNALILSDIEVPDQFADVLRLAMLISIKKNFRTCIIAGDGVASDQPTLTRWVKAWRKDNETGYSQDVSIMRRLISTMRKEWFSRVLYIEGNHDARPAKATGGEIDLGMLLEGTGVEYSRYPFMYVRTTSNGLVKIIHPANFSQDPVTLAQQFYTVEQGPNFDAFDPVHSAEKCHMVMAHCHRAQMGFSPDSAYRMMALGTCRDSLRTQYIHQNATKHRKWDAGFGAIEGGIQGGMRPHPRPAPA